MLRITSMMTFLCSYKNVGNGNWAMQVIMTVIFDDWYNYDIVGIAAMLCCCQNAVISEVKSSGHYPELTLQQNIICD